LPTQQTRTPRVVQRSEYDTRVIRNQLFDEYDEPIDLTDATVTFSMAFSMPRNTYYTSPRDQQIFEQPCVPDPDQVANIGYVDFHPGVDEGVDALTPPGDFLYQYIVTKNDGSVWVVPENTYWPLHVITRVGGRS